MNPYSFLMQKHRDLLDTVADNLPAGPSVEQLNEVLVAAVFTPDPEDPFMANLAQMALSTLLPQAYNGYRYRGTRSNTEYSPQQQALIGQMTRGLSAMPPKAIIAYFDEVEENILTAGLTYQEQAPLQVAAALGRADAEYWLEKIALPGPWAAWLPTNEALAYAQLPGVVEACVQGALQTYGLMQPPQLLPADVFASSLAATGLAAGKVVFGWVPAA